MRASLSDQRQGTVQAALSSLWELRYCGAVADAHDLYCDLASRLAVAMHQPVDRLMQALIGAGCSPAEALDFVLFSASLSRHETRLAEACALLADAEREARRYGLTRHFQLHFQRGLNFLGAADFGRALTEFHLAKRYHRSDAEWFCSSLNEILCLENLGLECSPQLAAFCARFAPHARSPWAAGVVGQLDALKARAALRQGDTTTLAAMVPRVSHGIQAAYTLSLAALLPFLDQGSMQTAALHRVLSEAPESYQAQFRLRTLNFTLADDDMRPGCRLGDKVERLYFWVWLWLAAPDQGKLQRILRFKDHLFATVARGQVTAEEFLQLENAWRWLALFGGCSDRTARAATAALKVTAPLPLPLLEYESRLLNYCFALRDGDAVLAEDARRLLAQHPARLLPSFLLPNLASALAGDGTPPPKLTDVASALGRLHHPAQAQAAAEGLYIDLLGRALTVCTAGRRRELHSDTLCLLLFCFDGRAEAPIEEVLRYCFAFRRYDPGLHDAKLAQLLLRANREFSAVLHLRRKGGCIYLESARPPAPPKIHYLRASRHVADLFGEIDRLVFAQPSVEDGTAAQQEPDLDNENGENRQKAPAFTARLQHFLALPEWKTRQDFEHLLGLSRASTNRLLSKWLASGLVERGGGGKMTAYKPGPALVNQIVHQHAAASGSFSHHDH